MEESVPWREALKEHLNKYSEGGVLLRAYRNDVGLTQEELGDKLKISQNHISEIENGKRIAIINVLRVVHWNIFRRN